MMKMNPQSEKRILTINSGSSSLKAALYAIGDQESLLLGVDLDRVGEPSGRLRVTDGRGQQSVHPPARIPNQAAAFQAVWEVLQELAPGARVDAVSHRIVHGGSRYVEPQLVTPQLIAELHALVSIDPDHLPQAIHDIEMVGRKYPEAPQIACFDTAFHRSMPRVAQLCPLPMRYFDQGILRYGFHGISYEYILSELRILDGGLAGGRVVVAHLGNGASMAAIRGGHSLDTTMGFTPTSGLLMGTRSGDIDPGVLLQLLARESLSPESISSLVNKQAGLLGVSGISADMQDLLAQEDVHSSAADAVALFCYRAKKYLAAYAAVLTGLDIVVFTAGIGEHSPAIRERICAGLEFLGIQLDPARNRLNAPVISSDDSRVKVRVMKTDENRMLARHAARLLQQTDEAQRSRSYG
ncbi:MAG TPA: acetate/propionate family kinase [Candidatus Acidoferrales bacterium]|nr:acetate/propionate family kinase [Candidatus Acidoferrales bacterium]